MKKPPQPTPQQHEERLAAYMFIHGDEGPSTREEKKQAFREAYWRIGPSSPPKVTEIMQATRAILDATPPTK